MSTALWLWSHAVGRLRRGTSFAVALCRALSDEEAYARHLAVHGRRDTPEEWRRFSDARLQAKFARGRCC